MNDKFMLLAIDEAKKALSIGEIPVGAVIVKNNVVIAKTHNMKEINKCAIYHAEILAIKEATEKIGNWRLDGCDIYITLEPCPMCASAIKQSRISNIYYGLSNSNTNNINIIKSILLKDNTNPQCNFYCGYFENEIRMLLKNFFEECRKNN